MTFPLVFSLAHEDCIGWLSKIESESVDLCVTDPAYESLEKHRAKGTTTRLKVSESSSNQWFLIFPNTRFPDLLAEIYRVLKRDTHCYVMSDQETAVDVVKPIAAAVGFTWKKMLVWVKTKGDPKTEPFSGELELDRDQIKIGMGYTYRASHEVVTYLEKGKRRLNDLSIPDVLPFPRIRNGYPTEKPVGLNRTLIEQSSLPGEVVIDPFNGSGSCGEAALLSDRQYAGCDLSGEAITITRTRLARIGTEGQVLTPRQQRSLF